MMDGVEDRSLGDDEASRVEAFADIPFEFVGEVAGAGAMAETADIESCATTRRHCADIAVVYGMKLK